MSTDPIVRNCRLCHEPFTIDAAEQAFFADLARREAALEIVLPKTCLPCRASRRRQRETVTGTEGDLTLQCVACGAAFPFLSRDRAFYAEHDFRLPRRCRQCRTPARQSDSDSTLGSPCRG